jgi:hypothetical protein
MAKHTTAYEPLVPDRFYRKTEAIGNRYFGLGATQLDKLIRDGVIEAPIKLNPNGRAVGWFGRTIIDFQKKLQTAG